MGRIFRRSSEYAGFGAVLGHAAGVLLDGVVLCLPGVNIVFAPVAIAATVATVTLSGTAVGTLVGAAAGAASGAAENRRERKAASAGKRR